MLSSKSERNPRATIKNRRFKTTNKCPNACERARGSGREK